MTPSANNQTVLEKLASIVGIGPWTTSYIAMRALNDPDLLPFVDLGLRKAAEQLPSKSCA
ncbi:MAG: hypothetical protein K8F91_19800 [Candidatus Obscuribacterales bacterium]|nr:hypothetical protein [Candidatus Obscuribacterales bacterium]